MHDINNENAIRRFSDDGFPTKHTPLEVSESRDVRITLLRSFAHVSWLQSWSPCLFSSFRLLDHDMNRYLPFLLFSGVGSIYSSEIVDNYA